MKLFSAVVGFMMLGIGLNALALDKAPVAPKPVVHLPAPPLHGGPVHVPVEPARPSR